MNPTMSGKQWEAYKVAVAASGLASIAVGEHLAVRSGLSQQEIGEIMLELFQGCIDGGANSLILHCAVGDLRCYARRQGSCLDVGDRADFESMGWGAICDVLDAQGN